jgi:hypothetical protein
MENNLTATIIIYYMDGSDQWHTMYKTKLACDTFYSNRYSPTTQIVFVWICWVKPNSVHGISLTVHRIGIELYTSLMTFKTFSTIRWSSIYDWLFATVMHVPRLVCVCYSTVNIGKCKEQVTELLLHMTKIKFWKFDEYGLTSDNSPCYPLCSVQPC